MTTRTKKAHRKICVRCGRDCNLGPTHRVCAACLGRSGKAGKRTSKRSGW